MPTYRRILSTFLGALALFALPVVSALAAPEFLDGTVKGLKFSFTGGQLILTASGFNLTCQKHSGTGEITGAKTATLTLDCEEAEILGLALISLGDTTDKTKGGLMLITMQGELCTLSTSPLEIGIHLLIGEKGSITEKVHLEIPSVGELVLLAGSIIGKVTPINVLQTTTMIKFPKPALTSCKKDNGATLTAGLKTEKSENKKQEAATLESTESLTFAFDIETMG